MDSYRLGGKTAIVTGAAGGIGFAVAMLFVKNGCNVLAVDVDESSLRNQVESSGSNQLSYCTADVTNAEDNARMVELASERYGGIDILVANAGIEGQIRSIMDYEDEAFDRVMAVNVKGVWNGIRAVVPSMINRGGGSIVITSSVAGLRGGAMLAPYCTSKHAIIGLMRSAAKEFAGAGIRVNTVNPSPVETRMMRSLEQGMNPQDATAAKERIASTIPLQRYAEPEEVANLMLFLASDESSFITGAVYAVDGGNTA
ncbi:MAG: SDR family NAD(P)-dependent oxidoreductase [Gammaproteobacteria bacterium]|nr:SDR family NAD(P)-dependent oxidoreductase [Gammaproteobacteria bacterium]